MRWNYGRKVLELERPELNRNYITVDYRDRLLDDLPIRRVGGNSCVFRLVDPNDDEVPRVIKFCKYYRSPTNNRFRLRRERFEREIDALKRVGESEVAGSVIGIFQDGEWADGDKVFRYYVMEHADCDLQSFLAEEELTYPEKLRLCLELAFAVKALHDLGIYHRDLKPSNILFVEGRWKIGDLGLVDFRDQDVTLDMPREKIGPFGFVSPEAVNKALGNEDLADFDFDCRIDNKSDVFQLAKVFWFVMQGEVPTGQVKRSDFKRAVDLGFVEAIVLPALQYRKARRPSIDSLHESFKPICAKAGII